MTRMVVLLVDALGWTLAQSSPGFAAPLVHRRRLETVLGFSSGALPTIFTGRPPAEHGRWLMYRRAHGRTPFAGFEHLRLLPKRVRASHRLGRFLSGVVARRGVHGYFHLYDVPREQLPEFDLPERGDIFAPGGLPGDSLWDTLERRHVRWRGWNWRSPESRNLDELVERVAHGDEAFLFCYTAELDARFHHEGSRGPGVAEAIRTYDALLGRLETAARTRGDRLWLYLLSDHGMVDVTGTVDVMGALAQLPVRAPKDYLGFFDSTMARFWWRRSRERGRGRWFGAAEARRDGAQDIGAEAREPVRRCLAALPGGRWLSREELLAAGAPFADSAWGDDVWLLDPGRLMVPSYMGRGTLAAMHGYDPAHPDMAALLWSNRAVPEGVRSLTDVRGYLESELDALGKDAA